MAPSRTCRPAVASPGLGKSRPSHPAQAIGSLPGAEDFLDPAADPPYRSVMGMQSGKRFGATPDAGSNGARDATSSTDDILGLAAAEGAVGVDPTRRIWQHGHEFGGVMH